MLFDLQGPRKTFVKAIYLGLAILMAGGLVLFGIGSNVNGGLADIFSSGSGAGSVRSQVEDAEKAVQENPKSAKALEELIANRYSLAGQEENYDPETQVFSKEGQQQLEAAKKDWEKYLKLTDNQPKKATATYAVSIFLGLQDAKGATAAQELITTEDPTSANYLALMLYALYAGDSIIASGAEVKARELASKDQIDEVNQQIKKAKKQIADRNADIQKQIQQSFAEQQSQTNSGSLPGNPFSGAPAPNQGGAQTGN